MSRSAAFALPGLHGFGVGLLVFRLKEKELSQSKSGFDERPAGFGGYRSRGEHMILSHTFTNSWQRIIFDLPCATCASNRRPGLSAHPNAAITHDVDVSFQRNRGIVCLPGDA